MHWGRKEFNSRLCPEPRFFKREFEIPDGLPRYISREVVRVTRLRDGHHKGTDRKSVV